MLREQREELLAFYERPEDIIQSYYSGNADCSNTKRNLRKIDILNKQYKHGKITKKEFEQKVKEIPGMEIARGVTVPLDKGGSKAYFDQNKSARPNRNKGVTDLKSIRKANRIDGVVDDITFEKLDRHLNICRTTDNFREYKQHHSQICKMCGFDTRSCISMVRIGTNNKISMTFISDRTKANIPPGSKLYHTSKQKNITRLRGTFRSTDGVLYPTMRVYFNMDNGISKQGGLDSSLITYEYTGSVSNAYVDNEIGRKAVYIETNTSVPVRKVGDKS